MTRRSFLSRAVAFCVALLVFSTPVQAAEIRVASSGGFAAAYQSLAPRFERETGNTLVLIRGPSMGDTPEAVPARLRRGEPIDVVIMVGYALDDRNASESRLYAADHHHLMRPSRARKECRHERDGF